jgi:hypothetical protein
MRQLRDIAMRSCVYSPDRSRAATWRISRERDDIFDSDTVYEIELWDASTGGCLQRFTRTHSIGAGGESGKPVAGVAFDEAGVLWIRFADGSSERAE